MEKQFFRICSMVLVIVLLVNMLPMSIFAEEFRGSLTAETEATVEIAEQTDARIVGEIPSKRTQYSKEFMLSNGLHLAAVYPDAVHYEEDGSWEEIDNTLILKNGKYINTAGVWNVSFPQQLSDSKSVTIEKDGYTLSFAMVGELRSTGLEIAGAIGEEDVASVKESVMQVLENPVQELSMETEATAPTMETAALETVLEETEPQETIDETIPEETVSIEATEPEETIVETVPETTVAAMETEPEIIEPLPEATVPTEVEREQIITDVMPEQLSVSQMQLSTATVQALDKAALQESYQYAEMAPEKLYSRLSYANVYQNTDVIYDMDSNRVKESIVMEAYSSTLRGYKYTLNVGQMIPVLEDDGQILFYDADQKNVVMVMLAPYLVDAAEESSWDVRVQLTGGNGIYTLTYLLPTQWLAAPERAWPVILDPVVKASLSISNIKDDTVSEKNEYGYENDFLEAGHSNGRGISRIYLKYENLPQLTSSDVIVAATVQLQKKVDGDTVSLEVHKVNGTWTSSTINWSNKPAYNQNIEDYAMVGAAGRYTWIITDVVRDWYANQNTGMMFKVSDAEEAARDNRYKQFYSSDQSTTSRRPTLSIIFRNNNGLENYWDYTSSSAGRAGTGYINNYTGNMTWIHNDLGFGGSLMPVNINHVYNLNDAYTTTDSNNSNDTAGNSFGMGVGWRTNYNQLVYHWERPSNSEDNTNLDYYIWEDDDGTDHYFLEESANEYTDEDGLKMTLKIHGSGEQRYYTITDEKGNVRFFDKHGRLEKLENNQQTKSNIQITYTTDSGKLISTIKDGAGRVYNFTYSNNLLSRISYKGTGTSEISYVTFTYTSSKLTTITDKDGKASNYAYSGNCLLTAQDVDGYKLTYAYNTVAGSWQPYRVLSVEESDGDAKAGKLTFAYGHNQTTITDHNGNTEIYQFNDWGNTVSIQDDEGHATFAQYARNKKDETAGKANQLKVSSKLQNTVGNIAHYSNFEYNTRWAYWPSDTSVVNVGTDAYIGSRSVLFTATQWSCLMSDYFPIEPGATYTFSAYLKGVSGDSTMMIVNRGTMETVEVAATHGTTDWKRVEVSFTNTTNEEITGCAQLFGTAGTQVYFDCAQIEKAATASRYNLVENGDFRHSSSWTISANCTSTDTYTTISGETHPAKELQNTYFKFTGNPAKIKNIKQDVAVKGSAGDSFVLAGWAKGHSAPLTGDRKFAIRARFNYTDGTTSSYFDAKFNTAVDQWQYSAVAMVAGKAYSSITVAAVYDYNVNTAYFDGIQLYKEEFGSSYTYDGKGNVTKVVDLQKKNTTYEYNSNGDITRILEDNQAKMTYTYDSWHNVKTATTDEGVIYTFDYDAYGNNKKVTIGNSENGGATISSRAQYTTDGNRLLYTWDALDKKTSYGYNENTGMMDWVQYPKDTAATRTNYTYDDMYRMATTACTTNTGKSMSAEYTYTNDYLTSIQTPTTTYDFTYGDFGLRESVKIGNRTLATYNYTEEVVNDRKYDLDRLDYGNGDRVEYEYDDKGRVTKQTYEDNDTVTYTYDNNGNLATMTDSATGRTTTYYYDLTDRMMKYAEKCTNYSHSVGYEYDTKNNLTKQVEEINGTKRTTTYTYDDDNRAETVTTDGITVAYFYDDYGRIDHLVTKNGSTEILTETYTYVSPTATTTSSQIATYKTTSPSGYSVTYTYTYDDNGNITSINDGTKTITYTYDSANQLRKEECSNSNTVTEWMYDNNGNIIMEDSYSISSDDIGIGIALEYSYGESGWGDLMTGGVSYDPIGNPESYKGWELTWEHGRQLAKAQKNNVEWTYTYNADGLRTSKTNDVDTWNYVYNGSQLTQLTKGTDTLYFTYDASGTPLTVKYNGTTYYYATNIQGDVVAILGADGTQVVTYSYDAWGSPKTPDGSMASNLGALNPLRYRGYVFDQETGLYYLQSRYYDPEMGRFISIDDPSYLGSTGLISYNLFSYCNNNPVSYYDPYGTFGLEVTLGTLALYAAYGAGIGLLSYFGFKIIVGVGDLLSDCRITIYPIESFNDDVQADVDTYKPHTKNKSEKNRNKHEKADSRRQRDQGGEKKKQKPGWKSRNKGRLRRNVENAF